MGRSRLLTSLAMLLAPLTTAIADKPLAIASGAGKSRPMQPQIAVADDGTIHLAYGADGRMLYCQIAPSASIEPESIRLPTSGVISLGMRRGPRIASSKSGVCVTLIAGEQGKGKDGDVLALCSSDGGARWTKPIQVNDVSGSAREGLHAMASAPNGKLACAWLDLRNQKSEVMMALSDDGGSSWSTNSLVYKSPDGDVCPCCHPSIAFGSDRAVHAMWRNALSGARDMYVATSRDDGKTFSTAKKLGLGSWKLDACPMDGGMLCADAKGTLATIWRRENKLFLCELGKNELGLGMGEQPWIASTAKGPGAVWVSKRGSSLMLLAPGESKLVELDKNSVDPVVAATPDGKSFAVAWERREGEKSTVFVQRFELK
jgi:hypothetical protein